MQLSFRRIRTRNVSRFQNATDFYYLNQMLVFQILPTVLGEYDVCMYRVPRVKPSGVKFLEAVAFIGHSYFIYSTSARFAKFP
jgi:hypothetical protein